MCLTTEKLRMCYWPKYDTYIGIGYKILSPHYERFDVWQEAHGNNEYELKKTGIGSDNDNDLNLYIAGFHIFLNPDDAKNYDRDGFDNFGYNVYKVDYTDVVGFGTQESNGKNKPCVITRYMFVHSEPVLKGK